MFVEDGCPSFGQNPNSEQSPSFAQYCLKLGFYVTRYVSIELRSIYLYLFIYLSISILKLGQFCPKLGQYCPKLGRWCPKLGPSFGPSFGQSFRI